MYLSIDLSIVLSIVLLSIYLSIYLPIASLHELMNTDEKCICIFTYTTFAYINLSICPLTHFLVYKDVNRYIHTYIPAYMHEYIQHVPLSPLILQVRQSTDCS